MFGSEHSPILFLMTVAMFLVRSFFFAIPLLVAFEVFGLGARVIDCSRGAQYAEQASPLIEARVSPLEHMASFALGAVAFVMGGYQIFFQAARGCLFGYGPVNVIFSGASHGGFGAEAALESMLRLFAQTLASGLSIGAPVLVTCFLIDIVGGIVGRIFSPSSISSEITSAKLVLGLFVGMYACWFLSENVSSVFGSALNYLQFFDLACSIS